MLSYCLILSTCSLLVLTVDPYSLGPHTVDHVTINPEYLGELDHYLEVYTPRSVIGYKRFHKWTVEFQF